MATEIRQGVVYEITGENKTGAAVDEAVRTAEEGAKKVAAASEKSGAAALKGFSPLRAVMAALHGNFATAAAEIAKLIPAFGKMGIAASAAFGIVGLAVQGVISALSAIKDLVKVAFNLGAAPQDLKEASAALSGIKAGADSLADSMARARSEAERQSKIFEDELAAINRLTKAQNDFNRAQELALATSEEMRAEINRRYDAAAAQNEDDAASALRANKRSGLKDEESRLREELAAAEKRRDEFLEISRRMTAVGQRERTGFWGSLWGSTKSFFTGGVYGNDKALGALNAGTEASNAYFDELDKIEELERKIEDNRHAQKMADLEEEAATEESYTRQQQKMNEEVKEDNARLQEAAKESAAEIAESQKRTEAELHAQRMRDVAEQRAAVAAAVDEQRGAEARLAAAKAQVQRAWGWYRDKDSMARQLEEEKAEAAAQSQFEKDFDRLRSFRSDWRTAKNLSVDDEAVRRVALAREEEDAAQKAVLDAAEAAREAADSLAVIERTLTTEEA